MSDLITCVIKANGDDNNDIFGGNHKTQHISHKLIKAINARKYNVIDCNANCPDNSRRTSCNRKDCKCQSIKERCKP